MVGKALLLTNYACTKVLPKGEQPIWLTPPEAELAGSEY
jgi:hypothetical protein